MNIEDRLIKLAYERKALINKVAQIAHELSEIPQSKHTKFNYSTVKVSDLSSEEQERVIRFTHSTR